MEMISEDKLRYLAGKHGHNLMYLEKDYFLTLLLYMIRDIQGIYFKGGTCLNKIFFNHTRLSEDLDFVSDKPIGKVRAEIERVIDKRIFSKLETDRSSQEFVRYLVYFRGYFQKRSHIILDINRKASIHLNTETHKVKNFYNLDFEIRTLNKEELVAEKIRALITRNQPRDYFDAYYILKEFPLNRKLLRAKMKEAGETDDMERVFKNANKIYSRWEKDLLPLTNKKVGFLRVMRFLEDKLR